MTTQDRAALVALARQLNDAVTEWTRTKTDCRERVDVILDALSALPSAEPAGAFQQEFDSDAHPFVAAADRAEPVDVEALARELYLALGVTHMSKQEALILAALRRVQPSQEP